MSIDVMSAAMISLTFIGAQVAQKAASGSIDLLWERFTAIFEKQADRPLTPDATTEAAGRVLRENPELLAEIEAVFSNSSALRRARLVAAAIEGARILWIDDNPENNQWECATLRQLGAHVTAVDSTETAIGCLRSDSYDLILSDVSRSGSSREGIEVIPRLRALRPATAVVFYVGRLDASDGVPLGAFRITNRPDELLHLVMDALERRRL
jgi:CheY-like chemotaxis protein